MFKHYFSVKAFAFYFSLLTSLVLFHSCHLFEPTSGIPSYIKIDSIGFTITNPALQGSSSHKITDAWVYVDQQLLGVYQLPISKIPILASGVHEIDIRAGIEINGIASTRGTYPFYNIYSQNVNLIADSIVTIKPAVTYFTGLNFPWMENFTSIGNSLTVAPGYTDSLGIINESQGAFEGNSCQVFLLHNTSYFMITTLDSYPLPTNGNEVYLEMNYKTNTTIGVGLLPTSSSQVFYPDTVLEINPNYSWNKIYVDLTSDAGVYPNVQYFKIFFGGVLDPGITNPEIYFDNFKLIYQ